MGKLLKVGATNYGITSIVVAEAGALRDGVSAAIQSGFNSLWIEGDNTTVIQALAGKTQVSWKITTIIEDIRTWLNQNTQFQVKHIYRETNKAADWLSKIGHSITNSFVSDVCFSQAFRTFLEADVVGRTLARRGA